MSLKDITNLFEHPAMPNNHRILGSLTIREYFAAKAPTAIPDFFRHVQQEKPTPPKSWNEIKWDNKEDEDLVRQWLNDPIWDLADDLKWYQDQWTEYNEQFSKWVKQDNLDKYFQWRYFYADMMIKYGQDPG